MRNGKTVGEMGQGDHSTFEEDQQVLRVKSQNTIRFVTRYDWVMKNTHALLIFPEGCHPAVGGEAFASLSQSVVLQAWCILWTCP